MNMPNPKKLNVHIIIMTVIGIVFLMQFVGLLKLTGMLSAAGDWANDTMILTSINQEQSIILGDSSAVATCTEDPAKNYADEQPVSIHMATVGIELPITIHSMSNNTWEVTDSTANVTAESLPLDAEKGNVIVYGHDRSDSFSRIKALTAGDHVILKTHKSSWLYTVTTVENTTPDNLQWIEPTDNPVLTLITCDGLFSESRTIVRASLQEAVLNTCI